MKYYANNASQLMADPTIYLHGTKHKKDSNKNTKPHSMVSTSGTGSQAQLKIMSNSFYHGSTQTSNQKTLNVNQVEKQTVHQNQQYLATGGPSRSHNTEGNGTIASLANMSHHNKHQPNRSISKLEKNSSLN